MSLKSAYEHVERTYRCGRHGSDLSGFCIECMRAADLQDAYLSGVASKDGVQYTSNHQESLATVIAYAEDDHRRTHGSLYGSANSAARAVVTYLRANGFDL